MLKGLIWIMLLSFELIVRYPLIFIHVGDSQLTSDTHWIVLIEVD